MDFSVCQVRVTVGDSGVCCVGVTSFDRYLTAFCLDLVHSNCLAGSVRNFLKRYETSFF